MHEVYINQAELTLPSYQLYTEPSTRTLLKQFILKIVQLLRRSEPDYQGLQEHEIDDIVNFEVELALKSQRPELAKASLLRLEDADSMAPISPTWGSWVDFINDLWGAISVEGQPWVTKDHMAWFQLDFLHGLGDMLAPFFEIKGQGLLSLVEESTQLIFIS